MSTSSFIPKLFGALPFAIVYIRMMSLRQRKTIDHMIHNGAVFAITTGKTLISVSKLNQVRRKLISIRFCIGRHMTRASIR